MKANPITGPELQKKASETIRNLGKKQEQKKGGKGA